MMLVGRGEVMQQVCLKKRANSMTKRGQKGGFRVRTFLNGQICLMHAALFSSRLPEN